MRLKIVGTGSKGNCYILENETSALIIECGVNFREVKKALNFDLSKVVGCIVTHEHGDHSKGIKETIAAGIDVHASVGTFNALKMVGSRHRVKPFNQNDSFKLGDFTIKSFDVRHDAAEPCGFLIHHPETGNVLFLTDTFYCPYTFKNLHNVIIEANFSNQIIKEKLTDMEFLRNRILTSHMSLETCVGFLRSNDLSAVNNIVLIHLSDGNSNERMFREVISKETGKNVTVADNGLEIEFNKTPF